MRSRVTPRKVGAETKLRVEPARDKEGRRLDCRGSIVKRLTEHFSTFSFISHSSDQSAMTSSADWTTLVASETELDEAQTAKSSAKREKRREGIDLRREARESIKKRNRKGPRTEPWGTPRRTRKEEEEKEPRDTLARRSERKARRKRTTN